MNTKPLMIFFIALILILFAVNMPATYQAMKEIAWNIIKNPEPVSTKDVIEETESAYKDNFKPRYAFIETNGEICNIMGRYSCNNAYKCSDGNVATVSENGSVSEQARKVIELNDYCKKHEADFMYVVFPSKEGYEASNGNFPGGVNSWATYRENSLEKIVRKKGVQIFDLRKNFFYGKRSKPYFSTDHHWKPESGFYAYTCIAKKLANKYGYKLNTDSLNLNNYETKTVTDEFLGSTGKRTGKLFSGMDSLMEITPKWETDMYMYADGEERRGSYKEVFFVPDFLKGKYYETNGYAYYVGGDYALTVQKNKDAVNPDAKVLIIEDSFSLVVKPYYSFMFGEVAAIDARRCKVSDSIKAAEYIEKENPELVILQYTEGVGDMEGDYGNPYDFGI